MPLGIVGATSDPVRGSPTCTVRGGVRGLLLLTLALSLDSVSCAGRGAAASVVKVWFLQGEQTVSVERPGSSATDAVTALFAGPTATERARGLRTYVPAGTNLNRVTVASGLARVDVSLNFVLGK